MRMRGKWQVINQTLDQLVYAGTFRQCWRWMDRRCARATHPMGRYSIVKKRSSR